MMIKRNSGSASCEGGSARSNGRRLLLSIVAALVTVVTAAFGSAVKPAAAYAATLHATVTPTIENASVGYVYYKDDASSATISGVTGSFNIYDFARTDGWQSHSGHLVFFVKPANNYLLTGLGASGNGDIYSVDATDYGNLADYPGISSLVARAKADGYVGFFGYSRSTSDTTNVDATFNVTGVQPQFELSATSDKTSGVKPGDVLTFTLTATPATSINDKTLTTESVQLKSVTINGKTFSNVTLTKQDDGTYQGTVSYTATADDCASGSVSLSAKAAITYGYALGVSDTTGVSGTINTTSTITTTASATCKIADNYGVAYAFTGDVPSQVTKPKDEGRYYEGDDVTVATVPTTVTEGDYTYKFSGWKLNGISVEMGSTQKMVAGGLHFTGNWTKRRNTGNLALSKTVAGNAANKDQDFKFELSCSDSAINGTYKVSGGSDGETVTFTDGAASITLRHGQTKTIAGLPAGATVSVKETGQTADTSTTVSVNGGTSNEGGEASANITNGGTATIAFTNKTVFAPDTGITLNTLPMVALAGVAVLGGAGIAVASVRKSNRERDDC